MAQTTLERTIQGKVSEACEFSGSRPGTAHRVVRNSMFNLLVQGVYAVFYLGVIVCLARGLGKEGFGQYYTLFALLLIVQVICEAGVSTVLTRRLARAPETWQATVAEAGGLFLGIALASVLVFLGLGALWGFLSGDATLVPCFALVGLTCAAMQLQRFCAAVFGAFEQFGYENGSRIVQGASFALAVLSVFLITGGLTLLTVLALLAGSQVLAALFLLASLQRRRGCLSWCWCRPPVKSWLSESIPLGLGDVLRGLNWQIPTVLLALLEPAAVVGLYSIAYRPLGPINWVPQCILTAVFPSLARNAEANRPAFQHTFAASMRLLWIASLPIGVFFCVCAEPVVLLLAGRDYLEAAQPLRLVIWISCLSFLSFPFRFLFTALGTPRLFAWLVLAVLTTQTVLGIALIPWWSYWGACAGSLLAETLFTVAGLILCHRLGMGELDWRPMAWAVAAAAVMAALLWPARGLGLPLLLLAAAGSTVAYFALCVLLGTLRREEVRRFREALGGRPTGGVGKRSIRLS